MAALSLSPVEELLDLMRRYPNKINQKLMSHGQSYFTFVEQPPQDLTLQQPMHSVSTPLLSREKSKLLDFVIEDLLMGAPTLSKANVGIYYAGGRFESFVIPKNEDPHADWVVLFRLTNMLSLQTNDGEPDYPQDDLNAVIYSICAIKSELNYKI